MPRYMLLIEHSQELASEAVPQSLHEEMGQFVTENLQSGVLVETNGLRPTSEGTRIRQSRRRITITDGPFTESKEVVGGYALVEVASRKEAVDLATRFMEIHLRHWPDFEGTCEVRPIDGDQSEGPCSGVASEAASS